MELGGHVFFVLALMGFLIVMGRALQWWDVVAKEVPICKDPLREAAAAAGLRALQGSPTASGAFLEGRTASGLRVRFLKVAEIEQPQQVIHILCTLGAAAPAISLSVGRSGPERGTGDDAFDETFAVGASPAVRQALLDGKVRGGFFTLGGHGRVSLDNGELRVVPTSEAPSTIVLVVKTMVSIAERLGGSPDVAARLAESANRDFLVGVRLRSLEVFLREYPSHPLVAPTLEAASRDKSPVVRLRAALALGEAGVPFLHEIAKGEDDASATEAILKLGDGVSADELREILTEALKARRVQTAVACIEGLAARSGLAAFETLARVLTLEEGDLATVAASALARMPSPETEARLVEALSRSSRPVRLGAAEALGVCGSTAAVLPLKEAIEADPNPEVAKTMRQAIAQIQERATGASPGQLSLGAGASGEVSLADADAGGVSMVSDDDAKGQVSLPPRERQR
jgi:HEAT repeat protein